MSDLKRAPLACASATSNDANRDNELDQTGDEVGQLSRTLPVSSCHLWWVCLCLLQARNLLAVI